MKLQHGGLQITAENLCWLFAGLLTVLLDVVARQLAWHHVLVVVLVSLAEGFAMVQLELAMLIPTMSGATLVGDC